MTNESTPRADDQGKLRNALDRFTRVRERYQARRLAEERFMERCGRLLGDLHRVGSEDDMVEAAELLGDLVAFNHTDGDGNEIRLIFSPQRDRAIINQRFVEKNKTVDARREGSDILLAIQQISGEIDPNRCLIFQMLRPIEVFAVEYVPDSEEPRPFVGSRFGLLSSQEHMLDFVIRLAETTPNNERPLPKRDAIPELIETCLEDTLARSIEESTLALERDLDRS